MKRFNFEQRKYLANYCFALSLAAATGLIFQRQELNWLFVTLGGIFALALISYGVYLKRVNYY